MATERLPLGVFTTDHRLVVRTWDNWIAAATGIEPARALNRRVAEVLPDISTTGLAIMEDVLSRGTVEVMATALHHYLFPCEPLDPASSLERMQQQVTTTPTVPVSSRNGPIVTCCCIRSRDEAGSRGLQGKR